MDTIQIRPYREEDESVVVDLWERCGLQHSLNDPKEMIERKMAFQPELFLVGEQDGQVVASVMAGYEGRRGWINLLAVDPGMQRRGLGRNMMEAAELRLDALGCPKVNLQVRHSNSGAIAFYERLGYGTDSVTSLGKRLERSGKAGTTAHA